MSKLLTKDGCARQFAALPFVIEDGETKIMLVTSRETRRWVLPKGWAEKSLSGPELAAKESFEEAGIRGEVGQKKVGSYTYFKKTRGGSEVECKVGVFPMRVDEVLDEWPERGQRERRWFTLAQAAFEVDEGDLVMLLLRLAAPNTRPEHAPTAFRR